MLRMKHIYTTMIAAALTTASFAQPLSKPTNLFKGQANALANFCPIKPQNGKLPLGAKKTNFTLTSANKLNTLAKKAMKRNEAAVNLPLIEKQPEGTLYENYYGEETGLSVFWSQIYTATIDGAAEHFVVADNGDVYIKNAMSTLRPDTWIKGHKTVGDTIAVTFPQNYLKQEMRDEETNEPTGEYEDYYLWRMIEEYTSPNEATLIPDTTTQTIRYVLRNDSLIRIDDYFSDEPVYLGLATLDGEWVGYADYLSQYSKLSETPVQLPASATVGNYQIDFYNKDGQFDSRVIKVAYDGNDVYFGNLYDNMPDAWAKGKIDGKKITFTGKQYLGVDKSIDYHAFFTPAGYESIYYPEYDYSIDSTYFKDQITFDYNPLIKTIRSDSMFIVNGGRNDIYELAIYDSIYAKPWVEKPGTPKAPEIYEFYAYDEEYGWGAIQMWVEKNSTDDVFLNPKNLYYNVFFDDEKYTFTPDAYRALTEEMTDVPIDFTENNDIMKDGSTRAIYFYVEGFETIGVQELYKDGDTEYRSEMAKYSVDEDGNITAINNKNVDDFSRTLKGVSYTDISGRTISKPNKGIFLKTLRYADGSMKTIKYTKR